MKKIKNTKLALDTETVRSLNEAEMRSVAGGVTLTCTTVSAQGCASYLYDCPTITHPCTGSLRNSQCYSC